MGKMKQLITDELDSVSLEIHGKMFWMLTTSEQDAVWKLATEKAQDKLNALADMLNERKKEGKNV